MLGAAYVPLRGAACRLSFLMKVFTAGEVYKRHNDRITASDPRSFIESAWLITQKFTDRRRCFSWK